MAVLSRIRFLYLSHLSDPAIDRPIYRAIHRTRARQILEIGVGSGQRAVRMIELAAACAPVGQVCYTGIDLFESRTVADGPGMSLKMAHRLLQATGARIQLIPGDPLVALAATANRIGKVDLAVVSCNVAPHGLERMWFYLPRILKDGSSVFLEQAEAGGSKTLKRLTADQVNHVAQQTRRAA